MNAAINNIYTVSQLNARVRSLLENAIGRVSLIGEISNITMPASGHWYFTLKDSRAQIKCAMFRENNHRVTFKLTNGNQILVRAFLSLYEPRGDYQIIVESIQPEGDGLLQQQFEELKKNLVQKGFFATSSKQPLPKQPRRVGIVTSRTGAALHDILHILKRRDPNLPVVIYPTKVQGKDAAIQIAQAIGRANSREECDVLIVGRGGGSLEDLWCFNEEIVVQTISASTIPIVSAIGHEVDVTLADFAADVRAPTPSAAAELVSQDASLRTQLLLQCTDKLVNSITFQISKIRECLTKLQHKLAMQHPQARLQQQAQQFDELERCLYQSMRQRLHMKNQCLDKAVQYLEHYSSINQIPQFAIRLQYIEHNLIDMIKQLIYRQRHALALQIEKLNAVSPLATLARGYSITRNTEGKVIKLENNVSKGDVITTILYDGKIKSMIL
ncbi:exodeoxyribonuclease VII large subunit [Candidatus Enterovibrio altilux]|uniref:Exodeoxyribonuclease 7 large subunit n=1 Tax=Candidatus Enterovibrio altilux TaxID=1927128 RepID=A0A291BA56_9GAMM|nr:exodeoxyribonuclease VII large subunit [Candidatus Enterovibrio luxaltus]ATF09867.1 Exodeoxyribonuclease VII large subunit [Candidatus Enterovibrio luxaltus]